MKFIFKTSFRIFSIGLCWFVFIGFVFQPNLTAQKTISLFNGKDLSGWSIQNNGQFSVENGLLKINKGTGWLRSDKDYGDYILILEFRFLEKSANSGIFVRTMPTSKNDENGWPDNGYQIQNMDTLDGRALGQMIPYGAPPFESVFDKEALNSAYLPFGKWQIFEIKVQGEDLWVKLNGTLITAATNIKNLKGRIGLQGEHGMLEFRKIELIKL